MGGHRSKRQAGTVPVAILRNLDFILISNGRLDKEFYGRKRREQIYSLKSPWGCGDRMAEYITAIKIATNLVA